MLILCWGRESVLSLLPRCWRLPGLASTYNLLNFPIMAWRIYALPDTYIIMLLWPDLCGCLIRASSSLSAIESRIVRSPRTPSQAGLRPHCMRQLSTPKCLGLTLRVGQPNLPQLDRGLHWTLYFGQQTGNRLSLLHVFTNGMWPVLCPA